MALPPLPCIHLLAESARARLPVADCEPCASCEPADDDLAEAAERALAEATLDLSALEGIWKTVYGRQDDLYAAQVAKTARVWRKIVRDLDVAAMIAVFRKAALMGADGAPAAGTDHEDPDARKHRKREVKAAAAAAAAGMLTGAKDSAGWDDLLAAITTALTLAAGEGFAAALAVAASEAGHAGFDWAAASKDGQRAPGDGIAAEVAAAIIAGTAYDLSVLLARLAAEGATAAVMATAVAAALKDASAAGVALTHAMASEISRAMGDLYDVAGVTMLDWITAGDGNVCFPAGTPVATPDGDRPIESLQRGEFVVTPQGQHRVAAASVRAYSGGLTVIEAEGRMVTATDDHPFWTPGGWREIGQLKPGDIVHSIEDHPAEIRRVVHITFAEPDDVPSGAHQLRITPRVPGAGLLMPVVAVRLNGNAVGREREVDRPPADLEFLHERNARPGEGDPHAALQAGLASELPVAGQGAELPASPLGFPWLNAELAPACPARPEDRRPAALLGAMAPVEVPLAREPLTAPIAVEVDGVRPGAGDRAGRVAMGGRSLGDREVLTADRAVLGDGVFPAGLVTLASAVGAIRIPPPPVTAGPAPLAPRIERNAAPGALAVGMDDARVVIATGGAEYAIQACVTDNLFAALSAFIAERHDGTFTSLYVTGIGSIPVYDIEVEHAHVFFAGGILVHNCQICADYEEHNPWRAESMPVCPDHFKCRCIRMPAGDVPVPPDFYDRYLT